MFGFVFVCFTHALPLAVAEGHFAQKERQADPVVLPNELAWAVQRRFGAPEYRRQHLVDQSGSAPAYARGGAGTHFQRARRPEGHGGAKTQEAE